MRDQAWLEKMLEDIWQQYFSDVKRKYPIIIKFGKRARTRLGSISLSKDKVATIRVTRLFADSAIPVIVVKATIIHELSHYTHGFHSGLKRKHKHPHAGGVIRMEFTERGLEDLYQEQKRWLNDNWVEIVKKHYPHLAPRYRRVRIRII